MKKILITGANGLLGQKLIYALLNKKDAEIIATSKGENRLREKEGYTYETLDITQKDEVRKIMLSHCPDTVINTAAMTNVDACESEKENCRKLNVEAVQNFIDVITSLSSPEKVRNCHFIHLSTDFVFDGEKGQYSEADKPNPLSYYSKSKYDSELILQESRIKWAIIRTIIIYGIVDNMSRSNVVLWAKESLEKQKEIKVVDDQFRSPTLAEDLAEACIEAAFRKATGIFHVSGKDIMSILELVYRVADFWQLDKSFVKPIKSDTLNQPAKRPPRTGFVLTKAIKELGYKPHSFEEGLAILDKQLKEKAGQQ